MIDKCPLPGCCADHALITHSGYPIQNFLQMNTFDVRVNVTVRQISGRNGMILYSRKSEDIFIKFASFVVEGGHFEYSYVRFAAEVGERAV